MGLENLNEELTKVLEMRAGEYYGERAVMDFLENMLTEKERETLARRLLIAKMIQSGKTRNEIINKLGVSPNTISRAKEWLEHQTGRYDAVMKKRLKTKRADQQKPGEQVETEVRTDPTNVSDPKSRYPMRFLFSNIVDNWSSKRNKKN